MVRQWIPVLPPVLLPLLLSSFVPLQFFLGHVSRSPTRPHLSLYWEICCRWRPEGTGILSYNRNQFCFGVSCKSEIGPNFWRNQYQNPLTGRIPEKEEGHRKQNLRRNAQPSLLLAGLSDHHLTFIRRFTHASFQRFRRSSIPEVFSS